MTVLSRLRTALRAGLTAGRRAVESRLATTPTPPSQDDALAHRPEETER